MFLQFNNPITQMEGGVGGTDTITKLTNEYRNNLRKAGIQDIRITPIINPLEIEAKQKLQDAGKARMVFFGADKIRQQKAEIIRKYKDEILPGTVRKILRTDDEVKRYKIFFYDVASLPILRRIREIDDPETYWKYIETKYPPGEAEFHKLQALLRVLFNKYPDFYKNALFLDKRLSEPIRNSYNALRADFSTPEYKGKIDEYLDKHNTLLTGNEKHAGVLFKYIDGTYHLFDSYGDEPGENSAFKRSFQTAIENLIYPAKISHFNSHRMQGDWGTCMLWSKIRSLHPEKRDIEFHEMARQACIRTGLYEKIEKIGGNWQNYLDLLAIAIIENFLEEGFLPPGASQATKDQNRRGLGRQSRQVSESDSCSCSSSCSCSDSESDS